MYPDSPKSNVDCGTIAKEKEFSVLSDRLTKCIASLQEAVSHTKQTFAPVIRPDAPVPCNPGSGNKAEQNLSSDHELLMSNIMRQVMEMVGELHSICERSSI